MKKLLLLLVVTTTMFFVSCEEPLKTCDEGCDTWQTCNEENNLCETSEGKCASDIDCTEDDQVCSLTEHICVDNAKACDVTCKSWETCSQDGECLLNVGKCNTSADCTGKDLTFCDKTHSCVLEVSCHFGKANTETNMCDADLTAINDLGITGLSPNQMKLYKNKLYIVNSGDNAIQELDLESGESNMSFLSMGDFSNPWNFAIDTKTADIDEFYVTNLMADSYYFSDSNNVVEQTVIFEDPNSLKGPEGIVLTTDNLFITNTNGTWDGDAGRMVYDTGFVTVAKKEDHTFLKALETTQLNPQNIFTIGDNLYVINSGTIESKTINNSTYTYPNSNSGIDIFDLNDLDSTPKNIEIPFIVGTQQGYVGSFAISDDETKVYLGSSSSPEIYLYDVEANNMIRNTDNPIVIDDFGTDPTNTMINLALVDGHIFAVNGNNDTLYVIDKLSLKVVLKQDIGSDESAVEMPQGIVFDSEKRLVYIFFGISQKIISIDIDKL